MFSVKATLKLARESIGRKNFVSARDAANQVLEYEPENYNAHVFLALALFKLDQLDESEQIYRRAIDLHPENILAWQGIAQFYEQIGKFEALLDTLNQLALLHAKIGDAIKLAEVLDKVIDISRSSDDKYKVRHCNSSIASVWLRNPSLSMHCQISCPTALFTKSCPAFHHQIQPILRRRT